MGTVILKINGQIKQAPEDWQEGIQVLATFDNNNAQATVSTQQFTFVADAAAAIKEWIDGGLNGSSPGVFEGIPIEIDAQDGSSIVNVFKGFIDFTNDLNEITPNDLNEGFKIEASIESERSLTHFFERAQGVTFALLETNGTIIPPTDYKALVYVVKKKFDFIELAILAIQTYTLATELARTVRIAAKLTGDTVAHTTGGATGLVAGPIYAAAMIIVHIAYIIVIIIQLVQLIEDILSYLIPVPKLYSVISLRTMFDRACQHLGFTFVSSIPELDTYYFCPSKEERGLEALLTLNLLDKGIPRAKDAGYVVDEFFKIMQDCFNARFLLSGNTAYFEALNNDAFWLSTSTYQMPDIYIESIRRNTDELAGTRIISFATDLNDEWTIVNFQGTNYEIKTSEITTVNPENRLIKGLDQIRIPWALGNHKETLSAIEQAFEQAGAVIDEIASIFGQNATQLVGFINNLQNALKVSHPFLNVPKLLKCQELTLFGQQYLFLAANHRDGLSAKYLYDNYINDSSFVLNSNRNQWFKYSARVPFRLANFQQLINNNYFITSTGETARAERIEWNVDGDYAQIIYRVRKKYTDNLQETYIEPR